MDQPEGYKGFTSLIIFKGGEKFKIMCVSWIFCLWKVVTCHLTLNAKASAVKMIAMGLDGKRTGLQLGVRKVWKGAALQSVRQDNGNLWRILAL